jgi:hypothetical protein
MAMTTKDVLIALPLIPLAPLVITWWLPWERWVPWGKLPKIVFGPYTLYTAFATWYFGGQWWLIFALLVAGTLLTVWAAVDEGNNRKADD